MFDDYQWALDIVQTCPIWAQDLDREITIEWVVETAKCDAGLLQVEYTRSPDLDRQFVSGSVSASVWEFDEEDRSYGLWRGRRGLAHIGLAKRWAAAQAELWVVDDANQFLQYGAAEVVWEDDEDGDYFGFDD